VFATAVHFHPSLIFASNAGGYQSEASCENPVYCYATSLACKYLARVELNGSGKHSELLYDMALITALKRFIEQSPLKKTL
jgi:hypothetical protein